MIGCVRWRQDSNNVKQSKLIQEKKSGGKKIQKKTLKNSKTLKKNKHQTSLNRTRSQKITLGNVCISVAADQKLKYYTDLTTQHNSYLPTQKEDLNLPSAKMSLVTISTRIQIYQDKKCSMPH